MSNPITPLTPEQTALEEQQALHEGWLHRVLVALDQTVNVAAGGKPDETISAHAARAAEAGSPFGKALSAFLNKFQPDHGAGAIAGDEARAKAVAQTEAQSGVLDVPYQGAADPPTP